MKIDDCTRRSGHGWGARRRGGVLVGALGALLAWAPAARAQPTDAETEAEAEAETEVPPAPPDPDRWEPGAFPALNYDSDIGFGFGAVGSVAKFEQGYNPYRLRVEAQLFMSAALDAEKKPYIAYHDHYVKLDLPGLLDGALRLEAKLAFGKFSNTGYYGLGAGSIARSVSDEELEANEALARYHTYGHTYPSAVVNARVTLFDHPVARGKERLEALLGTRASYDWYSVYEGSKLAEDLALRATEGDDGSTLAALLPDGRDHAVLGFNVGLLWDSRDDEYAPTRGVFTELAARISPGVDAGLAYVGGYLGTSVYAPLVPEHLVLATRASGDVLGGAPPLYELSQSGVLTPRDGLGGSFSVRGVPLRRYQGKVKVLSSLELRGNFPWFAAGEERMRFGAVAFADAGRVWADVEGRSVGGRALDGPHAPVALGVGGGARFQWGDTFILRADGAGSPTEGTSGFYIDVGQTF
ncbi:MAG: BamA/TamA family outer membrane protein [Myxococcales bacterium]|nr:BamA/TamA family outer membrane protein [Myxococcales bacterium]